MKTRLAFVLLGCIALSVPVACGGSDPQGLIVGKWEAGQDAMKITAEFAKDGKAKLTMFGQSLPGTYKVSGGDELEWTVGGKSTKYKLKITATELTLTSEGKTVKYTRVRAER